MSLRRALRNARKSTNYQIGEPPVQFGPTSMFGVKRTLAVADCERPHGVQLIDGEPLKCELEDGRGH